MHPTVASLYSLAMGELSFLHASHVPQARHRVDKHLDGYFSLQYMASGAVDLGYDGSSRRLDGEWFWLAFPGPRTTFGAASGTATWDHRHAAFQGPTTELWSAQGLLDFTAQPAPAGHRWADTMDGLLADVHRGGRWGKLSAANRLESILLTLAEARTSGRRERPDWLSAVLERLEVADGFGPDYEALAAEVNMAYSSLRHRFRQATGTSLHDYVIQLRMHRARDLLTETDLSIKSIASRLGYRDVYYFSRQFAAETGAPPARYRRSREL